MAEPQHETTYGARRRNPGSEPVGFRAYLTTTLGGLVGVAVTVLFVLALVAGAMLAAFGPAAPLVTVPNVVGTDEKDAQSRLESARLKMEVVAYEYDSEVKEGQVISTSPYEGKVVRAGRQVRAVVSRGGRNVKVPDLKGMDLAKATDKLTELDLQIGQAPRQANDKPDGEVLRQDPPAGTKLPRKSKINLAVSGGPDFGRLKLPDGKTFVFRTLKVTVPQGKALQMVSVEVRGDDMEESFLDRLCRPGEIVKVDLYGPEGARVRVEIEEERVFSANL